MLWGRVRGVGLVATMLLALVLVLAPGLARPAVAQAPSMIELHLERPVWHLRERMVVTGKLSAEGGPLANAEVVVGINGYLEESPYRATTAGDGTYRLEFWVEDWWGFGGNSLTAEFRGDDTHAPSQTTTIFQVAPDQVAPVALTIDPLPAVPVAPGQHVPVTGSLRNDRNEPAEGHSIVAILDAGTDTRAFATVDDQGRWTVDVVVPGVAGQWSQTFPTYHIPIVFEGDWWLAPAQQEVVLTLASPPAEAAPPPSPVPGASPETATTLRTPSSSATPLAAEPQAQPRVDPKPASWWPAWAPIWAASPLFLLGVGGALALLLGVTLISHARRPR